MNEFKNFQHLSFRIPSASEDFIRNTFCASFRKLKSENEALVRKVSGLEDELLSATLAKAKEVQNLQNDFDNERGYLEKRLADLERDLKAEKERYSESERGLKSKLCKLQLELRSREDLIEKSQTEHEQRSGEMRDRFSQELSRKSAKVKDLEEKLKDLAEELEQIKIAKEKSNQNWQKCELESSVVRGDLAKANQIIRKLQNEVKSSHGRLSLLNQVRGTYRFKEITIDALQVAHRQEEMAGVKESTVERLANDLKLCLQQLKSKDRDIERMRSEVKSLQAKCSESEVQLTAHQQVIASLNQELDSARLADPAILASGVAKINAERRCRGPRVPSGTRKTVDFDSNPVETNPKNGLFLHLDSEPPLREVMLRKTNQFSSANVLSKANKRRVF